MKIRASVVQACTAGGYDLEATLQKLDHYAHVAQADHVEIAVFPEALCVLYWNSRSLSSLDSVVSADIPNSPRLVS